MNESTNGRAEEHAFSVLLLRLNELIESGEGDAAAADEIRDDMDVYWRRMDETQRQRMRWLSVDLESITSWNTRPVITTRTTDDAWVSEIRSVYEGNAPDRTDRMLSLLRDARAYKPAGVHLYLQGRFYERAGLPEVALKFFEASEKFDISIEPITLNLMRSNGWMDRALPKALDMLHRRAKDPIAVYFACGAFMDSIRHEELTSARETLEKVNTHLTNTIRFMESAQSPQSHDEIYPASVITLGACLEQLGRSSEAIRVYDGYLSKRFLNGLWDKDIYALRGAAKEGTDHAGAMIDFRKAVELGTISPLPYLFVIDELIDRNQSLYAIPLCNRALDSLRDMPDALKALFYERMAIALSRIGQSRQWVLENFDRAIDLAPDDQTIRKNREIAAGNTSYEIKPVSVFTMSARQSSSRRIFDLFSDRTSEKITSQELRFVA